MADIRAAQNGDFSATSTWVGGVVPGPSDFAYANTYTVTISDTRTVQAISNQGLSGATAGGTFSPLSGCNLTCTWTTGILQGNTGTACLTVDQLLLGQTATINANITGGSSTNQNAVNFTSSGTVNLTGNLFSGSGSYARAVRIGGAGVLNISGNLTSSNGATCVEFQGSNATGSITGNLQGGTSSNGMALFVNSANCLITVNGTVTGGTGSNAIVVNAASTVTVNGICQAGSGAAAIGAGVTSQIMRLTGPFLLGTGTAVPVAATSWQWAANEVPSYMEVVQADGITKRNLYTSDNIPSANYPLAANVRSGVVYGPNLENTGTLAVPAPSSVALGVATDNTTGTAVLTSAAVRSAVGMETANLDTQLTPLSNLDATVSSRLAASSYSAAPSAGDIATAVWAAATRTLTTAIDNSSTIAAAVWSAVSRTITGGTVDTLTNAPSVPSAATIASQVRTELSTELGRIDAAVSSRLAPDGTLARVTLTDTATTLTNAPDVPTTAEIADEVRTELTPELARLSNAATTQEVAEIVEGALQPPP